ncbi:hypothetical protein [Kitasatospora sp. LaBMicrA B282]|uniref:hypothetical protein n=1 Tax=Kitasatospora sp. LaBMicrA B282 TaxID=3420949 RepID=UPI003D0F0AB9
MSTTKDRRYVAVLRTAGLALLPWIAVLALTLRDPAGWVALDVAEALALLGTARLLRTGHRLHRPVAALAALLLVADAGCDLGTATVGADTLSALAMALLAELPLALLCGHLVLRATGRASRAVTARPRLALAA